ncbi:hypothetical protein BDN72DRAFT_423488 [Pluteus cervinus]|uniref:Uncharacterized protein n=1 Tax=Pluteus cervinus TaxID=181527 RepID=A0ACD3A8D2_9AGAR|nr:hypothetical protein BDN72DRAFT_423488 [Pluteus cervinus]
MFLAEVKLKQPYHFKVMNALIRNRPSLVETGIGNNQSAFDVSVLTKTSGDVSAADSERGNESDRDGDGDSDEESEGEDTKNALDQFGDEERSEEAHAGVGDDDDDDEELPATIRAKDIKTPKPVRVKGGKEGTKGIQAEGKKLTAPRSGKSVPATKTPKSRKGTLMDRFSEHMIKEEETNQKAIDYKRTVAEGQQQLTIERLKVTGEVRKEQLRLEAQLKAREMEFEYKLKFAQAGLQFQVSPFSGSAFNGTMPTPDFFASTPGGGSSSMQADFNSSFNSYSSGNSGQWTAAAASSSSSSRPGTSLTDELNSDTYDFGNLGEDGLGSSSGDQFN